MYHTAIAARQVLGRCGLWATRVVLTLGAVMSAASAGAVTDQQVTSAYIVDLEFDQSQNRFVFSDPSRKMWIGKVDPATGLFNPPDGKGLKIDTEVAFTTDFGNGPEWLYAAAGKQLVYTKYLPNVPRNAENARLAAAVVVDGQWVARFLDEKPYNFPIGTLNKKDAAPGITYVSPQVGAGFYWRELDKPDTEELVPQSAGSIWSRRFVESTHKIVFVAPVTSDQGDTVNQVMLYDPDSKKIEQLTFDNDGPKDQVFMWKAPEFGGDLIFYAMVNRNELRFYRKLDDGSGRKVWTVINRVTSPKSFPYIWSPEYFVHNGKSYVFLVVSPSPAIFDSRVPTHIAMLSPTDTRMKLLSDPKGPARVRSDPEVFFTNNGPYIYYNNYIPDTDAQPGSQNGVWRIDPGLGPAALVPR